MKIPLLRRQLLQWFKKYGRNHYPWRNTEDPYRIFVAEIFLQRTKAGQVLPVYFKFVETFPTVSSLAEADPSKIKDIVYPLGLAWRGNNLGQTARDIMEKYAGEIPSERADLLKIKGVGDYVADSILYLAFRKRTSIIDSNVVRIMGRLNGIATGGESRRDPKFRELAREILPKRKFRDFNLALLDLGALVCKKKPLCDICPIKTNCSYHGKGGLNESL